MLTYEAFKWRRINLLSRIRGQKQSAERSRTERDRELYAKRARELSAELAALDEANPVHRRVWEAEKASVRASRERHEIERVMDEPAYEEPSRQIAA